MKRIVPLGFVFVICNQAYAESLTCTVRKSTQLVSEQELAVAPNSSATFGTLDGYRFKVTQAGASQFEIEVFDPSIPARSYAQSFLRQPGDEIKWTFWSQEVLLEAACRLSAKTFLAKP